MWLIAAIQTDLPWPCRETKVKYIRRDLILRPPEGSSAPDIRTQFEYPDGTMDAYESISRFLSHWAWWNCGSACIVNSTSCTKPLRLANHDKDPPLVKDFKTPPEPHGVYDPKKLLALALHREATSNVSVPYRFLGYFKILNIQQADKNLKGWINKTLKLITEQKAVERTSELEYTESDIGEYLYKSGRCAVAHAHTKPIVDPDRPNDFLRLKRDMPIVKALAEHVIIREMGIDNWLSARDSGKRPTKHSQSGEEEPI